MNKVFLLHNVHDDLHNLAETKEAWQLQGELHVNVKSGCI